MQNPMRYILFAISTPLVFTFKPDHFFQILCFWLVVFIFLSLNKK